MAESNQDHALTRTLCASHQLTFELSYRLRLRRFRKQLLKAEQSTDLTDESRYPDEAAESSPRGPASSPARILAGLTAGLAIGTLLTAAGSEVTMRIAGFVEPIGLVWLDALRMTIIPLVFSLLIRGIAAAAAGAAGAIAGRAILLFGLLLLASAILGAFLAIWLLKVWPPGIGAAEALRVTAAGLAQEPPTVPPVSTWIRSIIPANPIQAAADGAMLPLVVFTVCFGFAITRLKPRRCASLLEVIDTIADGMLVIVHWVLWLAPLGVFALGLVLGARTGFSALGALVHYTIIVSAICILITILVYPLAVFVGKIPLSRFATAALPAQSVAISTQSSLASLPAMLEGADAMRVPERVSRVVLPLAVALFRMTSPAANLAVVIYLAYVYQVELNTLTLAGGIIVATVISLAAVSLPSQINFFTTIAPICLAMNVPVEGLALLIAVETIPDVFRTLSTSTADLVATTIVARWDKDKSAEDCA